MIPIKKITVVDTYDIILESTYERRAKQLVKKGRAYWLTESKICLVELIQSPKESVNVETILQPKQLNDGYAVVDQGESNKLYDKNNLIYLAKRKVARRRNFQRHMVVYVIGVFLIFLYGSNAGVPIDISFAFLLGWTGIFAIHIFAFLKPQLTSSVISFFTRTVQEKVDMEYQKLEKLTPDKLEIEYAKLNKK